VCVPLTTAIGCWWCCIGAAEASVLRLTLEAYAITLGVGVPYELWLARWTLTDHNTAPFRDAWLGLYRAEIVTIEEGGVPVQVVTAQAGAALDWFVWAGFLLTPEAACEGGCTQSRRPTP